MGLENDANEETAGLLQTEVRCEPKRAIERPHGVSAYAPTGGWAEGEIELENIVYETDLEDGRDEFAKLSKAESLRSLQTKDVKMESIEVETEQLEMVGETSTRSPISILHGRKYIGMVVLPEALQQAQEELLYGVSRPRLKHITRAITDELAARAFVITPKQVLPADEKKYWTKHKHGNLEKLLNESSLTETETDEPNDVVARKNPPPKIIPVDYNDETTVLAYVASRMPSTYACIYNVLKEIKTRYPTWKPRSVLDYATGPGTTFWAANELWDIEHFVGVDTSRKMLRAAHIMYKMLPEEVREKKRMLLCRKTFEEVSRKAKFDLAVCAFAFERVTSKLQQQEVLRELLEHTDDMLVIIERSTAAGFDLVSMARSYLLTDNKDIIAQGEDWVLENTADPVPGMGGPPKKGFHVVAPCPHDGVCPLVGSQTPCAFTQRLQRPAITRVVRCSKNNLSDCGYSYVIIRKGLRPRRSPDNTNLDFTREALRWPRLLFPAIKRKGHVIMDLCSPEGNIQRATITKRHGNIAYRSARKSSWGDLFPLARRAKSFPRDTGKRLLKHKWSKVDR